MKQFLLLLGTIILIALVFAMVHDTRARAQVGNPGTGGALTGVSITPKVISGIPQATQFPGATADVQVTNAIASLPANGGSVDMRGYGCTIQTIAATLEIGSNTSPGKTITVFFDRCTTFNCTITNTTPCIKVDPGSTLTGFGTVAYPNAGLVILGTSTVLNGLLITDNFSSGLVGSLVEGISVRALTGATVTDAICAIENTLQLTKLENSSCVSAGAQNTIAMKIGVTAANLLSTNVQLDYDQFDCQGNTGCRPEWIGCALTGATPISCGTGIVYAVNSFGGLATHAGSGLPIVTIEASNGSGGANTIDNINFFGHQIENQSGNTTEIGFLDDGAASFHAIGLEVTCTGTGGADIIKIVNPAGTASDGVDVQMSRVCGWTNAINNTVNGRAIATLPRIHYTYTKSASSFSNFIDDGSGNMASVDQFGFTTTAVNMSSGANNHLLLSNNAPTVSPSTGFNTGAITRANGSGSFVITVGATGTVSTGTIALSTAAGGWNCWLQNQNRTDVIQQTGNTTTSATFTNFGVAFIATNWTSGDVLVGGCAAN
jgi:hypothetical protein